ncbi:unnamed protein product [Haemonchus placei]|uniref:Uncharacterized protein n=1 Tax=Haemonchus placei TaxID=6290 RepID=A0A0N4W8A6_HAEPC|nr:unnamed protein product [Haemonchus placei]
MLPLFSRPSPPGASGGDDVPRFGMRQYDNDDDTKKTQRRSRCGGGGTTRPTVLAHTCKETEDRDTKIWLPPTHDGRTDGRNVVRNEDIWWKSIFGKKN